MLWGGWLAPHIFVGAHSNILSKASPLPESNSMPGVGEPLSASNKLYACLIQEVSIAKDIRPSQSPQEIAVTRGTKEFVENATRLVGCHVSFDEPVQNV